MKKTLGLVPNKVAHTVALLLLDIAEMKYNARNAKLLGETQKIFPYQKKPDKFLEIF